METSIERIVKNGDGNTIIFTALAAAAIANTLPTPFDAIYFNRQRILKEKLEKGQISVERYWYQDIGEYYLWTSLWYISLLGVLSSFQGDFKTNSRILLALASGGLVIGVMYRNIHKDKEIEDLKKQQNAALLKN